LFFKKWDRVAWTGLMWLRIGTSDGSFEYDNELSGYIKCGGISWVAVSF
jgi:hypothetical protein